MRKKRKTARKLRARNRKARPSRLTGKRKPSSTRQPLSDGTRRSLITPRQVAVRAQETAFQLVAAMDRGAVVPKFLRRYATEQQRPGRIADAARFRDLVEVIRRESFLVLALQVETASTGRLRSTPKTDGGLDLPKLFRQEFYVALGRGLEYSKEQCEEFFRDLEMYRGLYAPTRKPGASFTSKGPFVDRCGFLVDSPMLNQGRRAAAQFESELMALASLTLKRVLSRRATD